MQNKKQFNDSIVFFLLITFILSIFMYQYIKDPSIIGFVPKIGKTGVSDGLILNLTFDDESDPWKDYSTLDHEFTANGNVNRVNRSYCKYYGCVNLSDTSGDYIYAPVKFDLNKDIAVGYWIYYETQPASGSSTQYIMMISEDEATHNNDNILQTLESAWGIQFATTVMNSTDKNEVGASVGSSNPSTASKWYHYFMQYSTEKDRIEIWQNGVLRTNSSESDFDNILINKTKDELYIGIAKYGDVEGYLDEVLMYNRSNFTNVQVQSMWEDKRLGTPPDLDLYIKNITYELPYDWSHENNSVEVNAGNNLEINITLANSGTNNTGNFDWNCTIFNTKTNVETELCSGRTTVNAESETIIVCNWTSEVGFFKGNCSLDTSSELNEDGTDTNFQRIYIPFIDRPWMLFNLSEWKGKYYPYFTNSSNELAYDSYDRFDGFGTIGFSDWSCNEVDPYGSNARIAAEICLINNYTQPFGDTPCKNAIDELYGWSNRTPSSCDSVQAVHKYADVIFAYDMMFPNLTENQNEDIVNGLHSIMQEINSLANPQDDNDDIIEGDNGKGFGSGIGTLAYGLLGAYKHNPTLIREDNQQRYGENLADEWLDRELSYLKSYKNDSWSKYQEGWAYKFYAQYHLIENLWIHKRLKLIDVSPYQNALNAMGRELITDILDYNYNGESLRNDKDFSLRGVQRGDSKSYESIGSAGSFIEEGGMLLYSGVLSDDNSIKQAMLWHRNKTDISDNPWNYIDLFLYPELASQIDKPESIEEIFTEKVIFDNADDILTIRTNYSYINDTVIQIDGGEERGGGHSQAQGYFLYALGEPFIDYEQVPYEDDTRMDVWKNGISLQNTSQTAEGTGGIWNDACGDYAYNQYFGMKDCSTPTYSSDYPDYRDFSLEYGGDLYNYVGTKDADFAGVFLNRPYKNSDDVLEYF
ncbi:hypothetical protein GF327_04090, partial [Candidatus Woesearchaeota archaeon]|nr:hypothetical protein [Candidatus Woesearchaeota archaeon]